MRADFDCERLGFLEAQLLTEMNPTAEALSAESAALQWWNLGAEQPTFLQSLLLVAAGFWGIVDGKNAATGNPSNVSLYSKHISGN